MAFHAYSTALEVVQKLGAGLKGKVVIVTGASSGIGVETARAFASVGAHVVCAVRNPEKAKPVLAEIIASTNNNNVELGTLDLASLASVREFAKTFLARGLPLHILINNAGIMAIKQRELTADGFESQFGTNHIGPFVLTNLLAPALVKGAPSRVVVLSSIANKRCGVNFEDVNFTKDYDKWAAYGSSKSANVLFAREFNRRMKAKGVTANAVHPGGIMTGLQKDLSQEEMKALGWITPDGKIKQGFKNEQQGASTSVWAALAPEVAEGGFYCEDCRIGVQDDRSMMEMMKAGIAPAGVAGYCLDMGNAERLWKLSEDLVGQKFDL